jgi:PAS domain S-box-containing protein
MSWSDRTKAMFGLPPEAQVTFGDFVAAVHSDDRARMRAQSEAALADPEGGDFSFEHRAQSPSGEVRWLLTHGRVLRGEAGERLVVGTCLDVTERKLVDERRMLVMRELAHRAKNGLSVMLAIINQTAQNATDVDAFARTLSSRLQAMADSQSLVTETNGRRIDLGSLLNKVLEPFGRTRFEIDEAVEEIGLSGDMALALALLTHELATNAMKYGSLSIPTGRVVIRKLATDDGRASVGWREVGGPPVAGATRTGFGTRLLQAALRGQGGLVEGRFDPDGFNARLEFPTPSN